jgi:hypothetical protein
MTQQHQLPFLEQPSIDLLPALALLQRLWQSTMAPEDGELEAGGIVHRVFQCPVAEAILGKLGANDNDSSSLVSQTAAR